MAALVAIHRLAFAAEFDNSTLRTEPVSTGVAPSTTAVNTNEFLAIFAVDHGLAVHAGHFFADLAPHCDSAVDAGHLFADLAPSRYPTIKTESFVANFTKSAHPRHS